MRGLRSTIALLVVLAGLGAYIYFVTWKKPEGGADPAATKEKVFAALEADKIEEIKVKSAAGDATTLKKDGGAWQIVAADYGEGRRVRSVGHHDARSGSRDRRASSTRTRPTSRTTASRTPRIESTSRRPATRTTGKLLIGDKTPTGGDLFAKRNDEKRCS